MFNLVSHNSVVLGPMEWRKTFFENILMDDLEISHTLPQSNTLPYVVDANTVFLPVQFAPAPAHNPKTQYLHGPFWDIQADKCVGSYVVLNYPLDTVRGFLKEKLADLRWKYEVAGTTVVINGVTLPVTTQRGDRDIFAQALLLGSNGANWKFGSTWITLSNSDLATIVQAIMTRVQTAFVMEGLKIDAINAATDLATLDAITFTEFNI